MSAHKGFGSDNLNDAEPTDLHHHARQSQKEGGEEHLIGREEEGEEFGNHEGVGEELQPKMEKDGEEEVLDSEGSPSLSSKEKPEFVFVELGEIRKDVQCPICLGIIRKTRTVMECLHRFCRDCIDKSMRMGNNECPACRTHCASRRSLRDDPNYDALIAALYPDIDKYEEEELALHEDERNRNKHIQESIALIFQKQSEALTKKRVLGKDAATGMITRSQRNHKNSNLKRRNSRGAEIQDQDNMDEENDDNEGKDSSSTDEQFIEAPQRKPKRRLGFRSSQPSSSSANGDSGYVENDLDTSRENRGISPGLVWNSEILAWGRGGARSLTRHGSAGGVKSKVSRSTRLTKLVDYLRGVEENTEELDIHLMLISLDEEDLSSLRQPYLCCRPSLSVRQLCKYVACETLLEVKEVEIMVVKMNYRSHDGDRWMRSPSISISKDGSNGGGLEILEENETLAGLKSRCSFTGDYLILGYRRKQQNR